MLIIPVGSPLMDQQCQIFLFLLFNPNSKSLHSPMSATMTLTYGTNLFPVLSFPTWISVTLTLVFLYLVCFLFMLDKIINPLPSVEGIFITVSLIPSLHTPFLQHTPKPLLILRNRKCGLRNFWTLRFYT